MAKAPKTHARLVLLDAHAILHRAYHALPDFATSGGEPTGALFGLISMILKIVTDLKPDYIVACYDLPKPTYRHEVYEGYKAGRAKTDGDLVMQMQSSRLVCETLNIPIYDKEGFEADDMLGTIVEQMNGKEMEIIIASGDMDTLQLVQNSKETPVFVYTLKKGINDTILYDQKAVQSRFGFPPKLLPDYKGLRGDPSDNIIGIVGIGEKTATDLIVNFGTIEKIYIELEKKKGEEKFLNAGIKKRIIDLLKNGKEEAEFSKMLATIRRDAPIAFSMPEKRWSDGLDLANAKELFVKLEFRTMGARLQEVLKKNTSAAYITDTEKAEEKNKTIAKEEKEEKQKEEEIKNIDPEILEETKVALWVADSNKTNPTLDDILDFAKTNSFVVAREKVLEEVKKRNSEFVLEQIEKPIIPIVKEMQRHGVLVDGEFLETLNKKYSTELGEIEHKIWQEAGESFNVASPKQLGKVIFDKLGLGVKNQKKTAGGEKSTKESELLKMKELHPIIPFILEYREIAKLLSTYIEPIPKLLDQTSKLHARFIQTGSTTGRMASENPNLQNIPIGSERGRLIRHAFLAPKGFKLVAFDYSQIELRIAAILSKDEKLLSIFKGGEDIHTGVASSVFGVPPEEVNKEMRRKAKVINFGILYGMGVNALRENLKTDRKEAQEFLNRYFEEFTGLSAYLDRTKEEANIKGYTETLFGRRRYFEGIKSRIPYIRASAERMAINAPIQGTNADMVKLSMIKINDWLKKEKLEQDVHLILQIHDELIYEIREEKIEEVSIKIKEIMQQILPQEKTLGVPIVANSSVGDNWAEMK